MSEDVLRFYFQADKSATKIDEIASRLVAIFERNGDPVSELAYEKKPNDCHISFWAPQGGDEAAIKDGLRLLQRISGDRSPHAESEMDQTNDTFFYALTGNHVVTFDSREELAEHLDAAGKASVEEALIQQECPGATVLLVRLKFDKRRPQKDLLEVARSFVADRSAENYLAFKKAIDSNSYSPKKVDYPFTKIWREKFAKDNMKPEAAEEYLKLMGSMEDDESDDDFYDRVSPRLEWLEKQRFDTEPLSRSTLGNLNLGHALTDCVAERNFLILRFAHETEFGIVPCKEDKVTWQARKNILNGEGLQALELLECLLVFKGVDGLSAKLYSPLEGASASFSSLSDCVTCTPWFDNDPLPPPVWP